MKLPLVDSKYQPRPPRNTGAIDARKTAWSRGMALEAHAIAFVRARSAIRILTRNYRATEWGNRAEIDFIALERSVDRRGKFAHELVFFEVRGRTRGEAWQSAEESVDGLKRYRLRRGIEHYLHRAAPRLPHDLTAMRADLVTWMASTFAGSETWKSDLY